MNKTLLNTFLAIFSGILAFLAFPPFEYSFLAWIFLIPLLFLVKKARGVKSAFFYSYIAGIVFFSVLLIWLVNVSVPGMVILVLVLALFYGLFGLTAKYVFNKPTNILILPFIWCVLEFVRSHLFTGFPWALLAYSQYKNLSLIQIADISGAYGVSFLVVCFNVALFSLFTRARKKLVYMLAVLMLLIISTVYGRDKLDADCERGSLRASVIQANIPQNYKWDVSFAEEIIKEYCELTQKAVEDGPNLIVWPETSYPYLLGESNFAEEINTLAEEKGIPILFGAVYEKDNKFYNSAFLTKGGEKSDYIYHKTHLVPFGEYVPFKKCLSFLKKYIDKPIGDFERGREFTLFPLKNTTIVSGEGIRTRQTDFYKFGVLICFEDIFPYVTRNFAARGADFVINITNDAWFGKSAASRQHLQASVFRAVENRLPVIRSANTGISCFIDSSGRITSKVETDGSEIFVAGYKTDFIHIYPGGKTYYTLYGDIFVYFCIFMILLVGLVENINFRLRLK
ncbi:MAG: apolipoprotein N-acyltransferase [Candidatus Omnitrophota bacterium]